MAGISVVLELSTSESALICTPAVYTARACRQVGVFLYLNSAHLHIWLVCGELIRYQHI